MAARSIAIAKVREGACRERRSGIIPVAVTTRTLLTELPPAWLAPAVVVCARRALVARRRRGPLAPRHAAPRAPRRAAGPGRRAHRRGRRRATARFGGRRRRPSRSERATPACAKALSMRAPRAPRRCAGAIVRASYHRRAGGQRRRGRTATRRGAPRDHWAEVIAPSTCRVPARLRVRRQRARRRCSGARCRAWGFRRAWCQRTPAAAPRRLAPAGPPIEPFRVVPRARPRGDGPDLLRRPPRPLAGGVAREECEPTVALVSPAPESPRVRAGAAGGLRRARRGARSRSRWGGPHSPRSSRWCPAT